MTWWWATTYKRASWFMLEGEPGGGASVVQFATRVYMHGAFEPKTQTPKSIFS